MLHYAARSTNLDLLRLLVNQSCDVLQADIYGTLPIHAALRFANISAKLAEQAPDILTLQFLLNATEIAIKQNPRKLEALKIVRQINVIDIPIVSTG